MEAVKRFSWETIILEYESKLPTLMQLWSCAGGDAKGLLMDNDHFTPAAHARGVIMAHGPEQ